MKLQSNCNRIHLYVIGNRSDNKTVDYILKDEKKWTEYKLSMVISCYCIKKKKKKKKKIKKNSWTVTGEYKFPKVVAKTHYTRFIIPY